jgi:hypothetical protein
MLIEGSLSTSSSESIVLIFGALCFTVGVLTLVLPSGPSFGIGKCCGSQPTNILMDLLPETTMSTHPINQN